MDPPKGALSGKILVLGDKKIVLNNLFSIQKERIDDNYLVTITLQGGGGITCLLNFPDTMSLLELANRRLEMKIKELHQANLPVPHITKDINIFPGSASSLNGDHFQDILKEGKISCNPYFVKILHNYLCLQKLEKVCAVKSDVESTAKYYIEFDDTAQDNKQITDKSVKKTSTPKSIEGFYGIAPDYFETWKNKCTEIDNITKQIFSEISTIGDSFLALNENTFGAIFSAPFNNTLSFVKSLNNCGIRYEKEQYESGCSENNPVTPGILMDTGNQTNIVVEFKIGYHNYDNVIYQAAGYVVSIADFYRKNSDSNQSCIPMISIIASINSKIIDNFQNEESDKPIGGLSVYGFVPFYSASENMQYIECVLFEDEEFTRKNYANLLQAICSVETLPQAEPISSHNVCIHGDKVYKCYKDSTSRSIKYAGYLPNAKMLCNNTVLVYDKIEGTHNPQNIKQVFCILKHLCNLWELNLCHGDIRLANMIFADNYDDSNLIDFDFCGKDGEAEYPGGYNTDILDTVRHKEATPWNLLKIEHDWFSMQSILRWYECEDEKELWQSLLNEETTWDKAIELISNCSIDKLDATLTPTDNNPFKDTGAKSNTILQKRKRPNTSQVSPPSKRIKTSLDSS